MGAIATLRARVALTLANIAELVASPALLKRAPRTLSGVDDSRGWVSLFSSGLRHLNFQSDTVAVNRDHVMAQSTVFSCITLIASDAGKLRAKLMERVGRIWEEITSPAFSPVLRKPNRFQTWQKFIEQWIFSLLSNGNTYVLKERDARGIVVALYVLDPTRCRPLVSQSGWVYYALQQDDLSTVFDAKDGENALPASEIIHDRINCLFHPLVGVSPLFACGLTATKGLRIEENAARFFANQSQPGGVLTAPGEISDETALRLKEYFESKFTGENAGKVAVLGDSLTYSPMTTNAVDAQLIEQLQWSAKQIAAVFHVPGYLVGAEQVPPNNNVEALTLQYYSQCLQTLIEGIENALDDGLGLLATKDGKQYGIELDLRGLLRMDTKAQVEVLTKASGGAYLTPDEARAEDNRRPVEGGDTLYKQHQDHSIAALAKRDAGPDPFGLAKPAAAPAQPSAVATEEARDEAAAAKAAAEAVRAAHAVLEQRIAAAELLASKAAAAPDAAKIADDALRIVKEAETQGRAARAELQAAESAQFASAAEARAQQAEIERSAALAQREADRAASEAAATMARAQDAARLAEVERQHAVRLIDQEAAIRREAEAASAAAAAEAQRRADAAASQSERSVADATAAAQRDAAAAIERARSETAACMAQMVAAVDKRMQQMLDEAKAARAADEAAKAAEVAAALAAETEAVTKREADERSRSEAEDQSAKAFAALLMAEFTDATNLGMTT